MFEATALAQLDEAIDRLAAEDVAVDDDEVLGAGLVDLRRRVDRLDAEWQRRFAVFERRAGWKLAARTAAAWLRQQVHMAAGEARMRVLAVRRLPVLPATGAAYEAGEISFDHVATITRSVTELREEHVAEADAVFAEAATHLPPRDLHKVVAMWRDAVDPEASIKDLKSAHDRRKLWYAQVGDMLHGEFRLDPVDGEPLLTALSAFLEADRVADDPRSATQRRADALVALAEAALRAHETPMVGGERPHVAVTIPLETIEARAGGTAELEWGGPITGEVARMLACDARVCRIITDPNGIPVEASVPTRTVPRWLRRLLAARDKGCRMPGCDRKVGWCVAHHIVFWGHDGPTELQNLVLLCREHHADVHVRGWMISLEADGTVVATSPEGIDYEDPPPARDRQLPVASVASEERASYQAGRARPGTGREPPDHHPARAGPLAAHAGVGDRRPF